MITTRFFIIDVSDMTPAKWNEWGREQGRQRYSNDGTKLIVDFQPPRPVTFRGQRTEYSYEEIQAILLSPEWAYTDPVRQ